jgi:hypothetical protein
MVHTEQKALRAIKARPVITDENLSRKKHPGQHPTAEERSEVPELIIFRWEKSHATGVPEDTRLFASSR